MRLMISGGGTGGHVYPALAVRQMLEHETQSAQTLQLLWVGSIDGMETALVEKAGIPYQGIAAGGLRGKNPLALVNGLVKLWRGYQQSKRLLTNYQPDVLFVTGGYACVPMTVAASRQDIPILIYLPDIEPGQAIKFLSRYADRVAVTAPPAQKFFPTGLTFVSGYPARATLYTTRKQDARAKLNLDPDLCVLLVFGGSQGARSLNKAIANPAALTKLLEVAQVVHISGTLDAAWTEEVREALPESIRGRYHLYPYLHTEMSDALASADLIISRAGASILGEATAVGTASILVPYPYSGAHQWANAQYLADQGAAIIMADRDVEKQLVQAALALLNDPERRSEMGAAALALAQPQAAQKIAKALVQLGVSK